MKYIVILGDGMADLPNEKLNNKTPLEVAKKPFMDGLAKLSFAGLCKTIPDGLKPGSDVANLSVLGYDPKECYTGRSPLEAASIGIDLKDTDVTLRANLVTLSDEENYEDKSMIDYSAGEISTEEARELIRSVSDAINTDKIKLYAGVSYRHCLVVDNGRLAGDFTPPHDITGKKIKDYLPKSEVGKAYLEIMKKSVEVLKDHPVNVKRIKEGKRPATSLWFWGEGTKPSLQNFTERTGLKGAMISAVDLLKGIGKLSGMEVIEVEGATGNYETNFVGKAQAVIDAIANGADFVYLHMEAPDECGHQGDAKNKVYSIERISQDVCEYIVTKLEEYGEEISVLVCPDHPTPLSVMTHTSEPIPFIIYRTDVLDKGIDSYTEQNAKDTGVMINSGVELMKIFLQK